MDRYKILLVEDNAIAAADARHRLEKIGHEVLAVVSSGEAAVAAVQQLKPDLLLMDIGLPGMDGIQAAGQVKQVHDVPVVYLTAHEDDESICRVKFTEPHGYLLKPSTDRELQITIELAMCRHRMERERATLRARIRSLEGIVPICSHCKKIRNDSGYWQQVEAYLSERTEVRFTHGICPECISAVYPQDQYPELHDVNGRPEGERRGGK